MPPGDPSSDPYRNADIMRMKPSVHLDRKLSATARLPKRSTVVESPTGRSAHPSEPRSFDSTGTAQQYNSNGFSQQNLPQISSQGYPQGNLSQSPQLGYQNLNPSSSQHSTPRANPTKLPDSQSQLRPSLQRKNTEVMIVDESIPNSPSAGTDETTLGQRSDDALTLADIPQWVEVAQAREQQRSLPRESATPYIAELNPLESAIVKHCAVLMLTRSPMKDQFDLDEILELVEVKKAGFWGKLFKGDNKKNVKKKGVFGIMIFFLWYYRANVYLRSIWCTS